jgi:hypothetical protein
VEEYGKKLKPSTSQNIPNRLIGCLYMTVHQQVGKKNSTASPQTIRGLGGFQIELKSEKLNFGLTFVDCIGCLLKINSKELADAAEIFIFQSPYSGAPAQSWQYSSSVTNLDENNSSIILI